MHRTCLPALQLCTVFAKDGKESHIITHYHLRNSKFAVLWDVPLYIPVYRHHLVEERTASIYPEGELSRFLRNADIYLTNYKTSHPKKKHSQYPLS